MFVPPGAVSSGNSVGLGRAMMADFV
jgi:hypothetical protein